jgi:hypothetical protein
MCSSLTPVTRGSMTGIGGKEAKIEGRGTVELVSICNSQDFILHLNDVLHIPRTRNNLISLGWWDTAGRKYEGGDRMINFINRDGRWIVEGKKVSNHLYKMKLHVHDRNSMCSITNHTNHWSFANDITLINWETWHKPLDMLDIWAWRNYWTVTWSPD